MKICQKLYSKAMEMGFHNLFVGLFKRFWYFCLWCIFGFDDWHVSPKEHRKYALDLIQYLCKHVHKDMVMVEIGCGMGEIVRSVGLRYPQMAIYGLDRCPKVISAAKFVDFKQVVHYAVGSFQEVKGLKIDYLITINFTHVIPPDALQQYYQEITAANEITHIVVDSVMSETYAFNHDFSQILPQNYTRIYASEPYLSQRYLIVFKKDTQTNQKN